MTGAPVGYMRVSRADEDGRSFEEQQVGQRTAIEALAKTNGYNGDVKLYVDWDRSADEAKEHKRVEFNAMLAAIERGEVSAVYARSLDRLYRSMGTFIRLTKLAKAKDVRIETERDGVLGGDGSPMAQAFASITAVFAELELETAKARARSRVKRQRENNVRIGVLPYGEMPGEDLQTVIDAFREAGSYQGAARLLIERKVPSRRPGQAQAADETPAAWEGATVRRIVMRYDDEGEAKGRRRLVPVRSEKRVKSRQAHAFARLIECPHDHALLTAVSKPRGTLYWCRLGTRAAKRCPKHGIMVTRRADTRYDCPAGKGHIIGTWEPVTDHPRPWTVGERVITPFMRDALANVSSHELSVVRDDGTEASITTLQEARRRYGLLYAQEVITEAEWDAKRTELDDELERLVGSARARLTFRLGLDWSMPAAELNMRLRELIHHIVLGPDMRPVGVGWRIEPTVEAWEKFDGGEEGWGSIPNPDAVRVEGGWYLAADG